MPWSFVGTTLEYPGGNLVDVDVVLTMMLMTVTTVDVNLVVDKATLPAPGVAQA